MLQRFYKLYVLGFFILFFAVGLAIFIDYGISWDEPLGRQNGLVNAEYISQRLPFLFGDREDICPDCPALSMWLDADHGPIFELVPTYIELANKLTSLQDIYHLRHLTIFIFFFIGVCFFYLLLQLRFNRPWVSLAGAVMLVASPRIFAESFYNAKDIPFLVLFIISSYTFFRFLNNKTVKNALFHGLVCGLAIAVRILGLLTPVLTVCFVLLSLLLFRKPEESPRKAIISLGAFVLFSVIFTVLFWPYLWEHTFARFMKVLEYSKNYPWNGNVLYGGTFYVAPKAPWHYLPVWMFLTIPVLYTALFLTGSFALLSRVFKIQIQAIKNVSSHVKDLTVNTRVVVPKNMAEQQDLVMFALFFIPFLANFVFRFVLYDSWRMMYFLYVPFLYLAVLGLVKLYDSAIAYGLKTKTRHFQRIVSAAWILSVGYIVFWMIKNHPYQYVYFSTLSGKEIKEKYELDYWGLSYKQALEHILKVDKAKSIHIHAANVPGLNNKWAIPEVYSHRLYFVEDVKQADYFVSNYRWHPEEYKWAEFATKNFVKEHVIQVDGIPIMVIYKLK